MSKSLISSNIQCSNFQLSHQCHIFIYSSLFESGSQKGYTLLLLDLSFKGLLIYIDSPSSLLCFSFVIFKLKDFPGLLFSPNLNSQLFSPTLTTHPSFPGCSVFLLFPFFSGERSFHCPGHHHVPGFKPKLLSPEPPEFVHSRSLITLYDLDT